MTPSKNGWLKEYLTFREALPKKEILLGKHPDESLYRIIQPTGIMYGQPVNSVSHPDMDKWSAKDKMKVLLIESLLNSSNLFQQQEVYTTAIGSDVIEKIGSFYVDIYSDLGISKSTFFGRKKDSIEIAEKAIDKRIEYNYSQEQNFWSRFFYNSLLFVDIYLFGQWIHTSADKIVVSFLKEEKINLYNTVCKVMAAAAHSNKNIEDEERRLFELFVNSTGLTSEDKRTAMVYFERGLTLGDVSLGENLSWIVKKYFLELASLTIWADKKVEDSEVAFLTDLNRSLGFIDDDFENSMIAVESFVIRHWHELDNLQTKRNFEIVSERFLERLKRMIEKNSHKMIKAIQDDPDLLDLLKRATISNLDEAELQLLEERFCTALKEIPSFRIIELPEHFLDYQIIKRVMPDAIIKEISTKEAS